MAADKRKGTVKAKAASPAKKRKVETPKAKPATKKTDTAKKGKSSTPKVTSTKVKKPEPKSKLPAKATKTPSKKSAGAKATKATPKSTPAKKTPASKTPAAKTTKTPAKTVKAVKKPVSVKKEVPKKAAVQPKAQLKSKAATAVTRAKLDKAKALKVKAAAAKTKLKPTKTLPSKKVAEEKKPTKSEEKADDETETKRKAAAITTKKTPEKATPATGKKRKIETPTDNSESARKRRNITPNKKFADFELDVPAKRTITPNKKYADYETDALPKSGKVSELRAFIQEKKSGKPEKEPTPKAEKKKLTSTPSPSKKVTAKKTDTSKNEDEEEGEEKIKVFKPSEMKPAEKLLKKLQKKLEKEAKGAVPASPSESREKAKIKITKVVDYKKPMSSEDVEMKTLAKKVATTKPKPATPAKPKQLLTAKAAEVKAEKPKATPKVVKSTAKQAGQVEKVAKPKKIKDMKREERSIQAKFVCQKAIQLPDDNQKVQCWITGIGVFPSGEIIMVDMSNRKIKLFSKDLELLSKVQLDAIPQDISVSPVNASCAYFTKPFSKEGIQKVIMSDGKLELKEYFVTNGTNRGIACTKAGILTSVQDGRYHDVDINHFKIYLLDYTGNILQSVTTDTTGSRLFKLPLYFTVNSTGKQIIVADCIKQNSYVLSVDMDGKIKFKYEGMNNNPITPRGLTIDEDDNIYVTEWERNNIYLLSPSGKRLQMLFSHTELQQDKIDGLLKPYQLCYYRAEGQKRLIVSQESCNKIKVFKLLTKAEMEAENAAEAAQKKVEEAAKEKAEVAKVATGKGDEKPAETSVGSTEVKPVVATPQQTVLTKPAVVTKTVVVTNKAAEVEAAPVPVVAPAKPVLSVTNSVVMEPTLDKESTNGQVEQQPVTTPKPDEPIIVPEKKGDIFADTANDFNDEMDTSETEVNGKLQDIVNAFPGEDEAEPLVSSGTEVLCTLPNEVPEVSANPVAPMEAVVEPVPQPQQEIIQQVIIPAVPGQEEIQTGTSGLVGQTIVDEANNILETVVVSEAPAENAFNDFQTIVYSTVSQDGDLSVVNDQTVIDTTVTTDPQAVTSETVYVSEYQNVVTDVPVELETITTEYVV